VLTAQRVIQGSAEGEKGDATKNIPYQPLGAEPGRWRIENFETETRAGH
jgi:hypothetical protein